MIISLRFVSINSALKVEAIVLSVTKVTVMITVCQVWYKIKGK